MDTVRSGPRDSRRALPHSVPLAVSDREFLDRLRQRARSVHARGRVAEALHALAWDIFGDDGSLHPAERRWLTDALAMPVSEAAYEAVDTLLRELADVLGAAPVRVRPGLAASPVKRTDFE